MENMERNIREFIRAELPRVATEIEQLFRNSIRLITRPNEGEDLPVGSSKLGGIPDLPDGVSWPEWQGVPLGFVAQINLLDVAELDVDGLLPNVGLLYFFYNTEQSTWGYDPKDIGSFAVIYCDGEVSTLAHASLPEGLPEWGGIFTPCALTFHREWTLPARGTLFVDRLGLTSNAQQWRDVIKGDARNLGDVPISEWPDPVSSEEDYYDQVMEMMYEWHEREGSMHRMLGYPAPLQDSDMELECQLASNGVYLGDGEGYKSSEAKALASGAQDWLLLLQVDTDDNTDMMWGDSGRIYFWIRRQDLEKRDFTKAWLVLQCF